MQLFPNYYFIPTGINKEVANLIIKECDALEHEDSSVYAEARTTSVVDTKLRKSTHTWIAMDNWIAGMMKHFVECANREEFHYDLTKWSNQIQYTVYDGEGSHYTWHNDIATSIYDPENCRKLSISLILSDPEEYEGGEFQLLLLGMDKMETFKPPIGSAIIFPSTAKHRVRPVKSGCTRSLVGWYGGPAFR